MATVFASQLRSLGKARVMMAAIEDQRPLSMARAAFARTGVILRAPYFTYLKLATGGMLSPLVYQELYRIAKLLPDLPFVEIGSAWGTGTIALAKAYAADGKTAKVVAVEKCVGGSRSDHGNFDDNIARLKANLLRHGVSDRVHLVVENLRPESSLGVIDSFTLSGFMHDADGRLDRDFALFWPRVVPGGLIVVDDFEDTVKYRPVSDRYPQGGIKEVMTYRLLRQLTTHGFFEFGRVIGNTVFGRKPLDPPDTADLPIGEMEAIRVAVQEERARYLSAAEKS